MPHSKRPDFITESLAREISIAAADLATRLDLGEFDDLDEGALTDLRFLCDMMNHWATVAEALELRLAATRAGTAVAGALRPNRLHS